MKLLIKKILHLIIALLFFIAPIIIVIVYGSLISNAIINNINPNVSKNIMMLFLISFFNCTFSILFSAFTWKQYKTKSIDKINIILLLILVGLSLYPVFYLHITSTISTLIFQLLIFYISIIPVILQKNKEMQNGNK